MNLYNVCKLYTGDCLELMKDLAPGSVDMVLCDLPYGTTSNRWDTVIPFAPLWDAYHTVCKGRVVLFAAQPFTSALVMSNVQAFKYNWTWLKPCPTGFQNAKKMPLRATEDVTVFGEGNYFPQGLTRLGKERKNSKNVGGGNIRGAVAESVDKGKLRTAGSTYIQEFTNYPRNILECGSEGAKLHPTQKPVALMEYLIRTYTNEGDTVLDNCMGSGTTGVACANTGRKFIGMEKDMGFYAIAERRIAEAYAARLEPK